MDLQHQESRTEDANRATMERFWAAAESHDVETLSALAHPDIVALIGGSAALTISGIPFLGPIAGARVGYRNGEFLLNPTAQDLAGSELDLVVAGTRDAVMMVESEAKELPEETMLQAVLFGQQQFQPVIDLIIELAEACAKEPWELALEDQSELYGQLQAGFEADLRAAYAERSKQDDRGRHPLLDLIDSRPERTADRADREHRDGGPAVASEVPPVLDVRDVDEDDERRQDRRAEVPARQCHGGLLSP